jgi:hypothetical protein
MHSFYSPGKLLVTSVLWWILMLSQILTPFLSIPHPVIKFGVVLQYVWVLIAGVPGVLPERFAEGMEVKHCALSLVGEPIMYPEISSFVHLLHERGISTFLVTNAQFPKELRYLVLILVQDIPLYLTLCRP